MFKNMRWRLTIWFAGLTAIVYLSLTFTGMFLFKAGLNSALDDELQALASEIITEIEIHHLTPTLQNWGKESAHSASQLHATIQLFNPQGILLEQYGPDCSRILSRQITEFDSNHPTRARAIELKQRKQLVGYLQIQLPLTARNRAVRQYFLTMSYLAPWLFLSLGISGYFFSSIATRPVEGSFAVLQRFISDAGHELSTPLSILQVNCESLEFEMKEKEFSTSKLQVIYHSIERLNSLVRDLILLGKMESPRINLPFAPVDLENCVKEVVQEYEESFHNKNIALSYTTNPELLVSGHQDSLKRMLSNLLQNALRYTETGGTVSVIMSTHARQAWVEVRDTGIGIPNESLPFIFQRFYRVDESRARNAGGSGLGLSIVRAIAEAHHGKVEVESQPGLGSTFLVILPLAR